MIALDRPFELLWLFLAPLFRLPVSTRISLYTLNQWHHLFDIFDDGGIYALDLEGWSSGIWIRPPPR